jgi:ABC-2 type transport system permease protein
VRKALAVGRKELRQIARDRRSLLVLVFVPAFFLLLYGYALNFDVQHIRLAVEDDDRTPASRKVISAFVNSGYFDRVASVHRASEYEELINRGDVRAVLVIPTGLERRILNGQRVPVQVIINGDNSNTAATVMGYALRILQTVSLAASVRLPGGPGRSSPSNRASGTTRSYAARCFWCRGSLRTSG